MIQILVKQLSNSKQIQPSYNFIQIYTFAKHNNPVTKTNSEAG